MLTSGKAAFGRVNWNRRAEKALFDPRALARLSRVSLRHLERYFLRVFGKTPELWLEELRLMKAAQRLARGRQVKEVSADFGYCNRSHFSRRFHHFFGCSQADFGQFVRAQHRLRLQQMREASPRGKIPAEWRKVFPFGSHYIVTHQLPLS